MPGWAGFSSFHPIILYERPVAARIFEPMSDTISYEPDVAATVAEEPHVATTIADVPAAVLMTIFYFLPFQDLCEDIARLNKTINQIAQVRV